MQNHKMHALIYKVKGCDLYSKLAEDITTQDEERTDDYYYEKDMIT